MKTRLFLTMAAATMILAGCSNDENEEIDNWNGEIRLSSGVTVQQTRTNSDEVPDKQIAENQEVGIFINDATVNPPTYAVGNNLKYTADGNGGLTLSEGNAPYYPATGGNVNIWAYQPYNAGASMSDGGYDFSVKINQNNANKDYYDSDLLYSSKTEAYNRQKEAQSLGFKHLLSKVVCILQSGTGEPGITGATVTIVNAETTGTFNPSNGNFSTKTTNEGVHSDITMNSAISFGTYIAVVPPQTFAKGDKLLKVTLEANAGGGEFYYTIPDNDLVLASGNVYTYTITVNLSGLTVTSSISAWEGIEDNHKSGTAEME